MLTMLQKFGCPFVEHAWRSSGKSYSFAWVGKRPEELDWHLPVDYPEGLMYKTTSSTQQRKDVLLACNISPCQGHCVPAISRVQWCELSKKGILEGLIRSLKQSVLSPPCSGTPELWIDASLSCTSKDTPPQKHGRSHQLRQWTCDNKQLSQLIRCALLHEIEASLSMLLLLFSRKQLCWLG